jgi:hypothetical protein
MGFPTLHSITLANTRLRNAQGYVKDVPNQPIIITMIGDGVVQHIC